MGTSIKKSEVTAAVTRELRSLAARVGVKFIGKKTEDLRDELLAIAVDDVKPAKRAKKDPEAAAGTKAVKAPKEPKAKKEPAPKKERAPRKERVAVNAEDRAVIAVYDTKKAKVITLRELNYSIHAIAEEVGLHPTNVSRYIREAGMSTSTATVPEARREQIRATIAARKAAAALVVSAEPVAGVVEPEPDAEVESADEVASVEASAESSAE